MDEERYEKQKIIGRGSYGEAYLVKSKSNQKSYVMKTINLGKTQEKPASLIINVTRRQTLAIYFLNFT